MLRNHFVFDGKSSLEYGIGISGSGTYNKPARRIEKVTVPGRNGDLVLEDGSYENIDYTFPAYIVEELPLRIEALAAMLLSTKGYKRLEDTYHPGYYRMGVYKDGIDVTTGTLNEYGTFEITFDCKPQRFLHAGEIALVFLENGVISNPTLFESKPLIRVWGTGVLGIGSESIQITAADEYTDIDCDAEEAYKDSYVNNCNGNIRLSGLNFPTLGKGDTGISLDGITRVEIIPRWWTL